MARIYLNGTIRIPSDEQAKMVPLLEAHTQATREENGCVHFTVTRSPDDPEVFVVDECFEDAAAFDHHQARGAASPWGQSSKHLPRDFTKREEP